MNYYARARKLATRTVDPSLTDQSQAAETDINVIVPRFMSTGFAMGAGGNPMYGDFTNMPSSLRDMIEAARGMKKHQADLPPQLKNMPIEELLALTPSELTNILSPPAKPPATEETKE